MLRRASKPPARTKRSHGRDSTPLDEAQRPLWEALRQKRRELAEAQGVPPYVIFHDATLLEMVSAHPRDREQLAQISGVGARKLEAYGDAFLAVLDEF